VLRAVRHDGQRPQTPTVVQQRIRFDAGVLHDAGVDERGRMTVPADHIYATSLDDLAGEQPADGRQRLGEVE